MVEMAIPVVVFSIILIVGLILLLAIYPKMLNITIDASRKFIKELTCSICKSILSWANVLCFC